MKNQVQIQAVEFIEEVLSKGHDKKIDMFHTGSCVYRYDNSSELTPRQFLELYQDRFPQSRSK